METGNRRQIAVILKQYKLKNGATNFPAIFQIPSSERIPELAKNDFSKINMLIIAALTMAFEGMNLKRGMNEIQILDLSEAIIDTAEEDNLSFEDLMLFLQNLVRGKYEMAYESLDIPKFMKLFEQYRQQRWEEGIRYRDEKDMELKSLGDANRTSSSDPLAEHFSKLGSTISNLKMSLRETRQENNVLKQADNFYGKK